MVVKGMLDMYTETYFVGRRIPFREHVMHTAVNVRFIRTVIPMISRPWGAGRAVIVISKARPRSS